MNEFQLEDVDVLAIDPDKTMRLTLRSPWENGYNESFNGKLRDELLNMEIFYTLKEAKNTHIVMI